MYSVVTPLQDSLAPSEHPTERHYYHPAILAMYLDVQKLNHFQLGILQRQMLKRFLLYTENLELKVVNPVFQKIVGSTGELKITSKEEYSLVKQFIVEEEVHAELATNLFSEITQDSVYLLKSSTPKEHLQLIKDEYLNSGLTPDDIEFLFVFASETLITKRLKMNTLPDMKTNVRQYMMMHLMDETRHRHYFLQKFKSIYLLWDEEKKRASATVIGSCIKMFLQPDLVSLRLDLSSLGVSPALVYKNTHSDYLEQATATLASIKSIFETADYNRILNFLKEV